MKFIIFKYEIVTPLKPESLHQIQEMVARDDVKTVSAPGIMGLYYHALMDSNNNMLCYGEYECFDQPCESYRVYIGDYRKQTSKIVGAVNCWFKSVAPYSHVNSVHKKAPEQQILQAYDLIKSCRTNKTR